MYIVRNSVQFSLTVVHVALNKMPRNVRLLLQCTCSISYNYTFLYTHVCNFTPLSPLVV